MEFFYKISITCFTGSYLVVIAIELARILCESRFLNSRLMQVVQFGFAVAGLFAHSTFLACHGGFEIGQSGPLLNNWYGWCLAASWVLAVAYLWISIRQPNSFFALFLMPIVLALIAFGHHYGSFTSFSDRHVRTGWNLVHGFSLLFGTAIVALGSVFGMLYLVQAHRLKQKNLGSSWLRLPSLEWLQLSAERCLLSSAVLLGIGLLSGIAITLFSVSDSNRAETVSGVIWSDPVVWSSGILFLWLVSVSVFNLSYQPARQGRKVAYLVVVSFLFLMLELLIAWSVGHATSDSRSTKSLSQKGSDPLEAKLEMPTFESLTGKGLTPFGTGSTSVSQGTVTEKLKQPPMELQS